MVLSIVWISAHVLLPHNSATCDFLLRAHVNYFDCNNQQLYETLKNQLTMLITQYYCKTLSKSMLKHNKTLFPVPWPKSYRQWPKMVLCGWHEARIVLRGEVTSFMGQIRSKTKYTSVHLTQKVTSYSVSFTRVYIQLYHIVKNKNTELVKLRPVLGLAVRHHAQNPVHSRNSAIHKIMHCVLGPIVVQFLSTCDCLGFYTWIHHSLCVKFCT